MGEIRSTFVLIMIYVLTSSVRSLHRATVHTLGTDTAGSGGVGEGGAFHGFGKCCYHKHGLLPVILNICTHRYNIYNVLGLLFGDALQQCDGCRVHLVDMNNCLPLLLLALVVRACH